jgi:hypothetical protein
VSRSGDIPDGSVTSRHCRWWNEAVGGYSADPPKITVAGPAACRSSIECERDTVGLPMPRSGLRIPPARAPASETRFGLVVDGRCRRWGWCQLASRSFWESSPVSACSVAYWLCVGRIPAPWASRAVHSEVSACVRSGRPHTRMPRESRSSVIAALTATFKLSTPAAIGMRTM